MHFPSAKLRSPCYAIVCAFALTLTGCGGGGGGGSSTAPPSEPTPAPTSVNSNAIKGPLENTEITLTDSTGAVIDTFTANGGSFVIDLPNGTSFPVTVTSSGGVDSILGNNVADENLVLKSVIFEAGQTTVNLNPFTTLMVDTALAKGELTQANIDATSDALAAAYSFGLPDGFNPVSSVMDDSNSPGLLMSFEAVFEVIRRVSKATGVSLNQVISNIAADLSDDVIDGVGADGVDPVSTALFNTSSANVLIESLSGTLILDAGGANERSLVAADLNAATALITGNAASLTGAALEPSDATKAQTVAALNVALRSADAKDQDALGKAVNFVQSIDAQNPPTAEATAEIAAAAKLSLDNVTQKNTDPDAAAASNANAAEVFANPDNNLPLAIDDLIGVTVGSDSSSLNILANDTGLGDTPIIVSIVSTGAGGSASLNADNTIAFVPDEGFFGQVAVEYEVTDADDESTSATALLFIDDIPVLQNFDLETPISAALNIDVLGSATGLGNTPVGFSISMAPTNGTLTGADGVYVYTPNTEIAGNDTAMVMLEDADGDVATSTILIFVDDQPVAVDDMVTTPLNTSVTANLLTNDSGLGNGPVTVTLGSVSSGGTAALADDTVTVTPTAGFGGSITVAYTVTDSDGDSDSAVLTVLVDDIPMANADSSQTVVGAPVTISVLANDTGLGNTPLSLTAAAPGSGTVSISGSDITYSPAAAFTGNDSFQYTVVDADGDQSTGTVTVFVDALAVAQADQVDTQRDTGILINVIANDNLGNVPTTVLLVSQPANGSAVLSGTNVQYTPTAGFGGLDSFDYQIIDSDGDQSSATVSINVDDFPVLADQNLETPLGTLLAINLLDGAVGLADAPITLVVTVQPTNGVLTVAGTTASYTPAAGFAATDSFQYTATDNNGDVDTATITVLANDTPAAGDDLGLETPVGTALNNINVLANDIQLGNVPITVAVTAGSLVGGTTVVNGDNTINFTPTAGFGGQGSFTYTVTDNDADTATASVQVFVEDVPTAIMDSVDTPVNTLINIDVLANDTGKLNTPLTVTVTAAPTGGAAAVQPDRTITYTPNAATVNTDNFSYTLQDSDGDMAVATVAVFMDDTPVAVDDTAGGLTTEVATLLNIDVVANDTGAGNSPLTFTPVPSANAGVAAKGDGTLDYTPNGGFAGNDSFTYSFTDSDGDNSGSATVNVFVNDTPVAVDDSAGTPIDTPIVIDVLANDTGTLNTLTALTTTTVPTGGSIGVIDLAAGTIRYIPNITGLSNNDSFQYQIEDTDGQTATATVSVGVGFAATGDTIDVVENITDADRILGSAVRTIDPLANDALGTDGVLSSIDTTGTTGMVVINGSMIDYTPVAGDAGGSDSFTYTISSALLANTSTATVNISVVSLCTLSNVQCAGTAVPRNEFTDIQAAVDAASPGDWVKIDEGTWPHSIADPSDVIHIDLNGVGTAGNPIRVEGFDGERPILQGWRQTANGWDDCTAIDRTRKLNFTSGGAYEVMAGDTISGVTSGASAVIGSVVLDSGSFAAGTAAGHFILAVGAKAINSQIKNFSSETLNVGANTDVATISGNSSTITPTVVTPASCGGESQAQDDILGVPAEVVLRISGQYNEVRNLEVIDATRYGLEVSGQFNTIENVEVHDSFLDNVHVGDRTLVGKSNNNVFRNLESHHARHGAGMFVSSVREGNPIRYEFFHDNVIEESVFYQNGYQPNGMLAPPMQGDSDGGGNSDGFVVSKNCEDDKDDIGSLSLNGVIRTTLCPDNTVSKIVVFDNADDGIDTTWGESTVKDSISFNNGPQGFKGYKVLRQTVQSINYLGNVAIQQHGGFEIRQDVKGAFHHNSAIANGDETPHRGITVSPTNLVAPSDFPMTNNLSAFNFSFDFLFLGGPVVKPLAENNWVQDNGLDAQFVLIGDPMITTPAFTGDDIDRNWPVNSTIQEKVDFIRNQVKTALTPAAGSPLIDAGKFDATIHCPLADDNGQGPDLTCRHWLGAAPDIGAFERE